MGKQFNWNFEEEGKEPTSRNRRSRWPVGGILFLTAAAAVIGSLIGGWAIRREQERESRQQLVDATQGVLDLGQQAMSSGDGELYFSLQEDESEWFAAQLLPANQDIVRSGYEVTNAEQHGKMIWVNAAWNDYGETFQRVLFFQWRAGHLRQVATDPKYWGERLQSEGNWGELSYYAVDDPWAALIVGFVDKRVRDLCPDECLDGRLPFTLEVRDDFRKTAEANHITIPSPRLLGLKVDGTPSSLFWQELSQRIDDYLTPATIRFAVPPLRARDGQTVLPYSKLTEQFSTLNPGITVELVQLESLPEDLSTLTLEFDGAAVAPTEAMLVAGDVLDLTDFVNSDPDFDKSDFYEQIWQGTVWRERSWFVPEAAEMQVLYYDKAAYRQAGYEEPSSRWTWDEMFKDVSSIAGDQTDASDLAWGFLDVGLDSLFSYAYNWNNQCSETATVFCQISLETENVAAALDWYGQMTGKTGQMPDLTGQMTDVFSPRQISTMETLFDEDRQAMLLLNLQGSRRKAAVWVDSPVNYEFNLLLAPVGVVTFPGSDHFSGITPLSLRGSFISQRSERPLAVWQWLRFLSQQAPAPRFVPARPSVAAEMEYWEVLPQPLGDIMRSAFTFARPVTIAEQNMLTWEQVTAVVNGDLPASEAATQPEMSWFGDHQEVNP